VQNLGLDKTQIEQRLKKVSPQLCVAFAARSALRVLPLLAMDKVNSQPFWYWKSADREKYLLAIFTAQQVSIFASALDRKNTIANVARVAGRAATVARVAARDAAVPREGVVVARVARVAAARLVASRISAAARVVAKASAAVYIDATATSTSAATAVVIAAEAAYAMAYVDAPVMAYTTASAVKKAILTDLARITGGLTNMIDPVDFLQLPLWPSSEMSKTMDLMWEHFCRGANNLDQGFDVWLRWYTDRLNGQPLDLELLEKQVNIPAEIRAQGPGAVNAYLETLTQQHTLKPLNLVRAIFIGNGAAGKTSLIRTLHSEPVAAGDEAMTAGIAIRDWPVGETGITARFWDFGGQVMSHATHQFFLRERCLYILVLDARSEFNANDQAEYWLEHVKAFGKAAPVMLVGNKCDLTSVNLDVHTLREKYANIVDFYSLSCTEYQGQYQSRFEAFRNDFIEQLQQVGTHQIYFTQAQFSVLDAIRQHSSKDAFLKHDKFDKLCAKQNISTEGGQNRKWLLDLLDKLGEVIHFPQMTNMDSYILNPRWLTYGVYTLLYSEELSQGRSELTVTEVTRILSKKKVNDEQGNVLSYPLHRCIFIIDIMEEFKLCYRLSENRNRFVIPDKLPSDQPANLNFDKDQEGTLAFEFMFRGFLPRHVMPMLIVSRHEEIVDGMVWQQGVILHNKKHHTTARVQVDYHQRVLNIWVQGQGTKEMLAILNDEVVKILKRMEQLEYEEMVTLPDSARIGDYLGRPGIEKATYQRLLAEARKGSDEFTSDSGAEYNLNTVLGSIMTNDEQKKAGININICDAVGVAVTVGDENEISVTAFSHQINLKEACSELATVLKNEWILKISDADVDNSTKMQACNELKKHHRTLTNIDNAELEEKSKLKIFLESIVAGKNKVFLFLKLVKANEQTISWFVEKSKVLIGFL